MPKTPLTIGYSTGCYFPHETNLAIALEKILEFENEAVELNLATLEDVAALDEQIVALAGEFQQVSIHAPMINYRYTEKSRGLLEKLKEFSRKVNSRYVLFHPDIVDDFQLIRQKLGSLAAFENMDRRKDFGANVQDLAAVFEKCPDSQWVCDLNHVFTIDKTMKLSKELHQAFSSRLGGYHISGYQDEKTLHTCFFLTHETEILDAIEDYSKLMIHEGGAPAAYHPDFIAKEDGYIRDYFYSID